MKKQIWLWLWLCLMVLIICVVGICLMFMNKPPSPSTPISMNDSLFYYYSDEANHSGVYAYNLTNHATQPLVDFGRALVIDNAQRVGSDTLGFLVSSANSQNGNATSAVYLFNVSTRQLTKAIEIPFMIDNIAFISPNEVAYTQPVSQEGIAENENIFLFNDGVAKKIGYILSAGEYGSTLNSSPNGQYLLFANQIYDTTHGEWQPVDLPFVENNAAWLNDRVIVAQHDDDDGGYIDGYDIHSHIKKDFGEIMLRFGVSGDHLLYDTQSAVAPYLSQISEYNDSSVTSTVIVHDALLRFAINGLGLMVYQPVAGEPTSDLGSCGPDCLGGMPSGSPMLFNLETNTSSLLGLATDTVIF